MPRKRLVGFAPLLAVAALAGMGVSAQAATPHWFKGGKRQPEGVRLPVMTWGGTINLALQTPAAETNCKTVASGYVENPKGSGTEVGEKGPAGTGQTLSAHFYECRTPSCEAGVKEKYGAMGYTGVQFLVAYNFPWSIKLQGTETFEEKLGAKPNAGTGQSWGETIPGQSEAYAEGFPARSQAPGGFGAAWGAPGAIGLIQGCEIFPNPEGAAALGGVAGQPERVGKESELPLEGELHALIGGPLNSAPSATSPAVTEFSESGSGELQSPLGPGAGGTLRGQLKYLGYETQSPISVNP